MHTYTCLFAYILYFRCWTFSLLGALIIRIGLWGPLYYNYNKESQQRSLEMRGKRPMPEPDVQDGLHGFRVKWFSEGLGFRV